MKKRNRGMKEKLRQAYYNELVKQGILNKPEVETAEPKADKKDKKDKKKKEK